VEFSDLREMWTPGFWLGRAVFVHFPEVARAEAPEIQKSLDIFRNSIIIKQAGA
jgi:hypothetical protein